MKPAHEPALTRYSRIPVEVDAAGRLRPADSGLRRLRAFWLRDYERQTGVSTCDAEFDYRGFTYLLDNAPPDARHEERVVVGWGAAIPVVDLAAEVSRFTASEQPADAAALAQFSDELHFQLDGISRARQARIERAVLAALGHFGRGIAELADCVLADQVGKRLTETVRARLRALIVELAGPDAGAQLEWLESLPALERLEDRPFDRLRSYAARVHAATAWPATRPVRRFLLEELRGLAFRDLRRRLAGPRQAPENARIRRRLHPVLADLRARPRSQRAHRHFRFLPEGTGRPDEYDVGHLIAHAAGGPPDVNFFAQLRSMNQGRSRAGRRYRWMERVASRATAGSPFFFSRLCYDDDTAVPATLEYGVLLTRADADRIATDDRFDGPMWLIPARVPSGSAGAAWWIGRFANRPGIED